jgi:hypothetical protein
MGHVEFHFKGRSSGGEGMTSFDCWVAGWAIGFAMGLAFAAFDDWRERRFGAASAKEGGK